MNGKELKRTRMFGLAGMLGGLLCSVADYLLEYMGVESTTLGQYGVIESAWSGMAMWRFTASLCVAAVAVPLYCLGFIAMARLMRMTHKKLGTAYGAISLIGALGGLFIHATICYMPVLWKTLMVSAGESVAIGAIDAMMGTLVVPFYGYYVLLMVVPTILFIVYCFKKGGVLKPLDAILTVGFYLLTAIVGSAVPALEVLAVGSSSRMIASIGAVAFLDRTRSNALMSTETME